MSPINTMRSLVHKYNAPKWFGGLGWMGAATGFLILSFYSVIAGWTLIYVLKMLTGSFAGSSPEVVTSAFGDLLADPGTQFAGHSIFMTMTGVVLALGVHKGLENGVRFLMPILFVMLICLFGYALTTPGFMQGWNFLFKFDFSKLTTTGVLTALGHAFFTLSLGMGAIMAYGAYMPDKASIGKTVLVVGVLDTLVALVAGLIIFPVVFSNGLEPASGPGLLFETMPIALLSLPGGQIFGFVFFTLVSIAAWTSAISIAEPAIAWVVDSGLSRKAASLIVCGLAWFLGVGTIFSFNEWADIKFLAGTIFENIDYLTANLLMPMGGVFIAVFVGWVMSQSAVAKEIRIKQPGLFSLWLFVLRYISPLAIFIIFAHQLGLLSYLNALF